MIVKDEAPIIERCLRSVLPLIDHVVIADTGSRDNTPEIIRNFISREGLMGQVVEHPWRNFAHNRSEALAALRTYGSVDYGFTIDADETLVLEEGFDPATFKTSLDADVYDVEVWNLGIRYARPALFSNRKPFLYKAVLQSTSRRRRAPSAALPKASTFSSPMMGRVAGIRTNLPTMRGCWRRNSRPRPIRSLSPAIPSTSPSHCAIPGNSTGRTPPISSAPSRGTGPRRSM